MQYSFTGERGSTIIHRLQGARSRLNGHFTSRKKSIYRCIAIIAIIAYAAYFGYALYHKIKGNIALIAITILVLVCISMRVFISKCGGRISGRLNQFSQRLPQQIQRWWKR